MELRSSEEQVQEMMIMYQSLRETEHRLPDIAMPSSTGVDNIIDGPSPLSKTKEAADVLSTLESLRERLNSLEPRTERFRKRLDEVRSRESMFCYLPRIRCTEYSSIAAGSS